MSPRGSSMRASRPVSSRTSLTAAASGSSPGSTRPFGRPQAMAPRLVLREARATSTSGCLRNTTPPADTSDRVFMPMSLSRGEAARSMSSAISFGRDDRGNLRGRCLDQVLAPDLEYGPSLAAREVEDLVASERPIHHGQERCRQPGGRDRFGKILGELERAVLPRWVQVRPAACLLEPLWVHS